MPIHRLLQHLAFDPDDVQILVSAYESCRKALSLEPADPKNETLQSLSSRLPRPAFGMRGGSGRWLWSK